MKTVTVILDKETMINWIKNKEQLYEENFTVRNAKPLWKEELYILGGEITYT
jgi:hypothetical protein